MYTATVSFVARIPFLSDSLRAFVGQGELLLYCLLNCRYRKHLLHYSQQILCRMSSGPVSYRVPFHKLHFVNEFIDIALSYISYQSYSRGICFIIFNISCSLEYGIVI